MKILAQFKLNLLSSYSRQLDRKSLTTDEKHGWTFAYRYEQIRLDKYEEDAAMKTDDMMTKHEFILTILYSSIQNKTVQQNSRRYSLNGKSVKATIKEDDSETYQKEIKKYLRANTHPSNNFSKSKTEHDFQKYFHNTLETSSVQKKQEILDRSTNANCNIEENHLRNPKRRNAIRELNEEERNGLNLVVSEYQNYLKALNIVHLGLHSFFIMNSKGSVTNLSELINFFYFEIIGKPIVF